MPHQPLKGLAPTPWAWRLGIGVAILLAMGLAYGLEGVVGARGQAALGVFCFIGLVAMCSANLRAVNWRTVACGFALQLMLAVLILKFQIGEVRPVYWVFDQIAQVIKKFLEFSNQGATFVFGKLADPVAMGAVLGEDNGFIFACAALPPIIFVSSFFTVLYHLGVLQAVVRFMARSMMFLMGTSGAETLSAAANVFMGQTEAPLIVKPYVVRMTQSELLALMVGGMATISGGLMAVYIKMIGDRADPVAILATSVMAAPCGLYLSKLLLPETEEPATRGEVKIEVERSHVNVIDAAAAGASDGLSLALNVAAMLIAFLALLALIDAVLQRLHPDLSLRQIFGTIFSPLAMLMGVGPADIPTVADLLGTKLAANEFVAFKKLTTDYRDVLSPRAFTLSAYALTGFANFASISIQLGGIGAMAPSRRHDLARLGLKALMVGFLATLTNAAIAGMLLD
ncbi:MAG: Na+ dependent nucleoside transporter domain protein [Gemmataceae bacterium]|nr:Na+ dependent nucleoside transporter domain protein [Gemmataceae bacterium]MDW8265388.1 nucleoside transporter C-terminal domain-containing protein [Gemmataceae bacterium]